MTYKPHWNNYEEQFVKHLLTASECRAIVFELLVIDLLEQRLKGLQWQRLLAGTPDMRVQAPEMIIECKMLDDSGAKLTVKKVLRATKTAEKQYSPDLPYVIAVGCPITESEQKVRTLIKDLEVTAPKWFKTRPKISGALVVWQITPRVDHFQLMGWKALEFHKGLVIEIKNSNATYPLPLGFSFLGN
ncbi:MAG: hypothetical protein HYU86_11305 [Chloroflexi bacterium]|nr:hypothetical protein [Chloroflexota bacterium]